jgi:hypothetical protein
MLLGGLMLNHCESLYINLFVHCLNINRLLWVIKCLQFNVCIEWLLVMFYKSVFCQITNTIPLHKYRTSIGTLFWMTAETKTDHCGLNSWWNMMMMMILFWGSMNWHVLGLRLSLFLWYCRFESLFLEHLVFSDSRCIFYFQPIQGPHFSRNLSVSDFCV